MKGFNRFLLILLAMIVSGQILWWAYLIISQKKEIATLVGTETALLEASRYSIMIASEAIFFFFVLSLGVLVAYKSSQKDIQTKQMQSDFLSAVTHELKTPLANVRLCLDTLSRSQLSEESREKYRLRAQRSVDSLIDEVETILTLVNKGQIPQQVGEVNLNDLAHDVIEQFDEELTKTIAVKALNQIKVKSSYPECRLIVKSLLDNAIRYSLRDDIPGSIIIEIDVIDGHGQMKISDSGIGFKPDDLKKAFEPFFRAEAGKTISPNGTGLGLPLVKRLGDAIGVKVWLESEGQGHGTSAFVIWPSAQVAARG